MSRVNTLAEIREEANSFTLDMLYEDTMHALIEVVEAARGVMTQMDYETPHHTRLRKALAVFEEKS